MLFIEEDQNSFPDLFDYIDYLPANSHYYILHKHASE